MTKAYYVNIPRRRLWTIFTYNLIICFDQFQVLDSKLYIGLLAQARNYHFHHNIVIITLCTICNYHQFTTRFLCTLYIIYIYTSCPGLSSSIFCVYIYVYMTQRCASAFSALYFQAPSSSCQLESRRRRWREAQVRERERDYISVFLCLSRALELHVQETLISPRAICRFPSQESRGRSRSQLCPCSRCQQKTSAFRIRIFSLSHVCSILFLSVYTLVSFSFALVVLKP